MPAVWIEHTRSPSGEEVAWHRWKIEGCAIDQLRAAAQGGAREGKPRQSRILRIASDECMAATMRSRPPQWVRAKEWRVDFQLFGINNLEMVDRAFTRSNQVTLWLRQLDRLRVGTQWFEAPPLD